MTASTPHSRLPRGPRRVSATVVWRRSLLLLAMMVPSWGWNVEAAAQVSPGPSPAPGMHGQGLTPDMRNPAEGVGIKQHLGDSLPLDTQFVDEHGNAVLLGDYFGNGRPVVFGLIYFECPLLCSQLMTSLTANLKIIQKYDAGEDFDVVLISIDHSESSDLAHKAWKSYTKRYDRAGGEDGWHFLVGERVEIDRVCEAVGYTYRYNAESDEYAHAAGIQVCTEDGILARYFYGMEFPAIDLRLGIVEASKGEVGDPIDEIILLCFSYDPTTGKYGLVIMNAIRLLGLLTLGVLLVFIVWHLRRDRKSRGSEPPPAGSSMLTDQPNL